MGKPTICIGENKGAYQLCSNCEADLRPCFHYSDSAAPLLLKIGISSSSFLCRFVSDLVGNHILFSVSVCVGPGRNPHCWFSHKAAQLLYTEVCFQLECLIHEHAA